MMSGRNSSSRYPFTASQWQELEHQALIFKYMASGLPIPPDLIVPIRRSFLLHDSPATSLSFPPLSQLGWMSCRQMEYGKKAEDPEPGRCRRTDGKKWRCSKEAYPDSKYCERHMHRGKNRSRKPVEISLAAPKSNHFSSSSSSSSSSTQMPPAFSSNLSIPIPEPCHLLCPYSTSGAERVSAPEFKTVRMNSAAEGKQSSYSLSKEEEEERQRPLRRFFDEWPEKNRDSWLDLEDESSSYTKTQLSISFPKWLLFFHSHSHTAAAAETTLMKIINQSINTFFSCFLLSQMDYTRNGRTKAPAFGVVCVGL
ncbi:Growth-regulating factor 1 [Platanthera zijinensis]|uniref:Growth-regulating factor n=1 Tax=Platanthera zijinensis TaxID=2320716 RepID=A0AAP0GBP5_9ASPA